MMTGLLKSARVRYIYVMLYRTLAIHLLNSLNKVNRRGIPFIFRAEKKVEVFMHGKLKR